MLIIGDIHITSKQHKQILQTLREYIAQYPQEKHIIFLWDYVYHFQYDRKALLNLFALFIELYQAGKKLWILAGNHDWIDEHFVFAEGKWTFDAMNPTDEGAIRFITEPMLTQIEGKDILFFPFARMTEDVRTIQQFAELWLSDHPMIQQSARANSLLYTLVSDWRASQSTGKLHILHHRYIVDTVFPGQQARFSYKSPGLSSHWLDEDDILLMSGHLHQPFAHKNYLCTGSVRHTSPLEINQLKYLFVWQWEEVLCHPVAINPYLAVEQQPGEMLDNKMLSAVWQSVCTKARTCMESSQRNIKFIEKTVALPVAQTTLFLRGEDVSYDTIAVHVDTAVLEQVQDYKIKKNRQNLDIALENLQDSSMQLDERISDWKTLLQRYLQAKYGEEYDTYYSLLQELKVLQ